MNIDLINLELCSAREYNGTRDWDFQIIEPKYDGRRLLITRDPYGKIRAHSRKRDDANDYWPHLCRLEQFQFVEKNLPNFSALDGELHVLGKPASDVITAINEGWSELEYRVFAVPFWSGRDWRDIPLNLMQVETQYIAIRCGLHPVFPQPFHRSPLWTPAQVHQVLCKMASAQGLEGFVLKNGGYSEWYKVKPIRTVDCVITGWFEGKGKYLAAMGGVQASVYNERGELIEIARVGGGWNDDQRWELEKDDVLGRVIEVRFDRIEANGRLRFPRFIRFRDDEKSSEECTLEQIQ